MHVVACVSHRGSCAFKEHYGVAAAVRYLQCWHMTIWVCLGFLSTFTSSSKICVEVYL